MIRACLCRASHAPRRRRALRLRPATRRPPRPTMPADAATSCRSLPLRSGGAPVCGEAGSRYQANESETRNAGSGSGGAFRNTRRAPARRRVRAQAAALRTGLSRISSPAARKRRGRRRKPAIPWNPSKRNSRGWLAGETRGKRGNNSRRPRRGREPRPLAPRRFARRDPRKLLLLPQTRRGGASPVGQGPKRPALFVDQRAHGGGNRARGKAAPRRLDLRAVKRKKRRLFALKRRNRRVGAAACASARAARPVVPWLRTDRSPSYRPRQVRGRAEQTVNTPPLCPCASIPPRICGNGWRRKPLASATRIVLPLEHKPRPFVKSCERAARCPPALFLVLGQPAAQILERMLA